MQQTFDEVIEAEEGRNVSQNRLLRYEPFVQFIEHPPILARLRAIFGNQLQLLQYDLVRQGPRSQSPERCWHRDFVFPGERPLAITTIVFLDDITLDKGPTRVVPGSHRGEALPPRERAGEPLAGEVAVPCPAGGAIFLNSAVWHTGGRNASDGLRRGIYLYYGCWWLRRFDDLHQGKHAPPWEAFRGASDQRLQFLGVRMPDWDIHAYDPTPLTESTGTLWPGTTGRPGRAEPGGCSPWGR
jgi:ectoine hydroxylase-related dioxygenase (phytanoyl-CoA dioxygenase family)